MRGKLESLEVRKGFTIKKGDTVYLNFSGSPRGVMQVEIVSIIFDSEREISLLNCDEENIDIEVYNGSRFSTYNSSQFRRNCFPTRLDAENMCL